MYHHSPPLLHIVHITQSPFTATLPFTRYFKYQVLVTYHHSPSLHIVLLHHITLALSLSCSISPTLPFTTLNTLNTLNTLSTGYSLPGLGNQSPPVCCTILQGTIKHLLPLHEVNSFATLFSFVFYSVFCSSFHFVLVQCICALST